MRIPVQDTTTHVKHSMLSDVPICRYFHLFFHPLLPCVGRPAPTPPAAGTRGGGHASQVALHWYPVASPSRLRPPGLCGAVGERAAREPIVLLREHQFGIKVGGLSIMQKVLYFMCCISRSRSFFFFFFLFFPFPPLVISTFGILPVRLWVRDPIDLFIFIFLFFFSII